MIKGHRGWWLLVPVALIGGLLALPQHDDFAEFSREGTPVPAGATLAYRDEATGLSVEGVPKRGGCRVRAWSLPSFDPVGYERLRHMGFSPGFGGFVTPYRLEGGQTLYARMSVYTDARTDARAVVLEGSTMPQGTECILFVEEPVGLGAAWNRWMARRRGLPRP